MCTKRPKPCFNSRPREGGDAGGVFAFAHQYRFNSRPREGGDCNPSRIVSEASVSTHAPAKGATANSATRRKRPRFQLTPPRRGRQVGTRAFSHGFGFNSRPREGGDYLDWGRF